MKKPPFLMAILCLIFSCELTEFSDASYHENKETVVSQKNSEFYRDLVFWHAPVHYQDVDRTGSHGLKGKADYITAYDYDGDFDAKNNWNNLRNPNFPTKAISYYSVTETETHYFILYTFFHPRDWTDFWLLYRIDEHENDLEGVLTVVKKDATMYGEVIAAVTVFHSDFYSYTTSGSGLSDGSETIDGLLSFENHNGIQRIQTSAEAKGHGIKAYSDQKPRGSDYVVYYPSTTSSEIPADIYDRHVAYELIDIFKPKGFWEQRFNTELLNNASSFQKSYGNGSANAPWSWNDKNDGSGPGLERGDIAKDPAALVAKYFSNLGDYSEEYIMNLYL